MVGCWSTMAVTGNREQEFSTLERGARKAAAAQITHITQGGGDWIVRVYTADAQKCGLAYPEGEHVRVLRICTVASYFLDDRLSLPCKSIVMTNRELFSFVCVCITYFRVFISFFFSARDERKNS